MFTIKIVCDSILLISYVAYRELGERVGSMILYQPTNNVRWSG